LNCEKLRRNKNDGTPYAAPERTSQYLGLNRFRNRKFKFWRGM
jgi:hypothetical protein